MTSVPQNILFALCLGLGGVVAWQALAPVSPIADPLPGDAVPPHPSAAVWHADVPPSENSFAVINARPIFDPTRRPVSEPAPTASTDAAPPNLVLVGVAISGGNAVALLKGPDGRAAISARIGQTIDGWELVGIEPGFVILHAGGIDYTIKLRVAAGLPQPKINDLSPPAVTDKAGP